ncbi:hypothetical protein HU200_058982 [Digitaria exilis]|uniref:Uncharacterized protein n=1 Tax=Digitaria exilis TaxID=1010633 RepID=A0A835E3B9_9POAL|nr:hypothetical protein HU200_058982 [Digitaria exilis]
MLSVHSTWPEATVGTAQTDLSLLIITSISYLSQAHSLYYCKWLCLSFPILFLSFYQEYILEKRAKLARRKGEEINARL